MTGNDHDLNFTYKYVSSAGRGVNVYIIGIVFPPHDLTHLHSPYPIDTGIYIQHPAFDGRASWGKTFGGYKNADGNGHGTHCAGTAVSKPYGVAKASHVIAVKVLNDKGSGNTSDV